ncbi:16808_t:CDS:2 [Dentiscutata erythropus]|uniref:16808_t:CDS:1 n=1 Tax=Dentiscutata erythropus TaxID=1348616 RepID=A0A9N9CZS6_9GLOM|nr:16808_t:CDS:2 [Dentiscutata erythropus]
MKFEKFKSRTLQSKWTKLFVLTSVLQLIIIVALEGRVLQRNSSFRYKIQSQISQFNSTTTNTTNTNSTCNLDPSSERMYNIESENVVFMVFQLFQLFLCMNAVYNQNTIQIITIAVTNFLCGLYGIVQIFEIKKWVSDLQIKNCPDNSAFTTQFAKQYGSYDIPLVIFLVIFASIIAFISFKLYQEFGWNIYKKIGADIQMQKIFKTMLIFVLLLKIDLFFVLLTGVEAIATLHYDKDPKKQDASLSLSKGLFYFHLVITIMILFLEVLAYSSLRRENKPGMILYIVLSTVTIADFCIILRSSLKAIDQAWYFFVVIVLIAVILSIVTWVFAILVYLNFDKGLRPLLDKRRGDSEIGDTTPGEGGREKIVLD